MTTSKICPLCGGGACKDDTLDLPDQLHHPEPNLQYIIYKHLHIELIHTQVDNVCVRCKQTIVSWNEFAGKCWETQHNLNKGIKFEKPEYVEIKIENLSDVDDKYSTLDDCKVQMDGIDKNPAIDKKKTPGKKAKTKIKDYCNGKVKKKPNEEAYPFADFSCYICSVKTKSWVYLGQHFSENHPSLKTKVLCKCGKYLASKKSVMTHNVLHDEAKVLKCEECGKKFGDKNIFKEHMLIHFPDNDYRFSCSYCQRKFFQRGVLLLHEKTHLPPELKNTFACDICGEKFGSKNGLQIHNASKHENIKKIVCDICGTTLQSKSNLGVHKKTVHSETRSFECDKCPKKFKVKTTLKAHRQNVHFPINRQCSMCPTILKSKRSFYRHKKEVHNDADITESRKD